MEGKEISIETFWNLLHDPANAGFSLKFRTKETGAVSYRHDCRKSAKRHEGGGRSANNKGLRYDILEKGVVLLESSAGIFTVKNRLIMAIRLRDKKEWIGIRHINY